MELRQLKYFVKVAELLSFSKAAKALYITQSTLSQQIKQLEDELDMALFFRNNHKVALTEAGSTFLEGAKKLLAEADDNKAKIMDLALGRSGVLNIGVTYSFGSILTESVLTFKKEFPDVVLNLFTIVRRSPAGSNHHNIFASQHLRQRCQLFPVIHSGMKVLQVGLLQKIIIIALPGLCANFVQNIADIF